MKGQTIIEYVILMSIVVMILYAMGPSFKRGVQGVVKVTADQLRPQHEAEQDFSYDQSHLTSSDTRSMVNNQRSIQKLNYMSSVSVNEITASSTQTQTNMGFTLDQQEQ